MLLVVMLCHRRPAPSADFDEEVPLDRATCRAGGGRGGDVHPLLHAGADRRKAQCRRMDHRDRRQHDTSAIERLLVVEGRRVVRAEEPNHNQEQHRPDDQLDDRSTT